MMSKNTPEDEIIYTLEDRPGKPERLVSYDDQQHSSLILWIFIILSIAGLAGLTWFISRIV